MEKFDDIQKELGGLRHISLSKDEKQTMREKITEHMSYKPMRSENTRETASYSFWFVWMRRPMPVIAAVLVFLVGGGAVAAAEGALPGDVLYPIKISVNEEVRGVLALSSEAKASWNISRAERRLQEATFLSADGRLTEETRLALDSRIEEYTNEAQLFAEEAENDDLNGNRFIALTTRIEIALNARDRITRAVSRATATGSGVATLQARNIRALDAGEARAPESALFSQTMQMESASLIADDAVQATELSKSEVSSEENQTHINMEHIRAEAQLAILRDRLKSTRIFTERAQHRISESSYERAKEEIARMEKLLEKGTDSFAKRQFVSASVSFENALQIALDVHDIVRIGESPIEPVRKIELDVPTIDPIPASAPLPIEIEPVDRPKNKTRNEMTQ